MKFPILNICLFFLLFISCKDDEQPVFINDWDEDVYHFADKLADRHKDLFHNLTETDFDNHISNLRHQTTDLTDVEIIFGMLKILHKIGDSHTNLETGSYLNTLSLEVEWLTDGLVVTSVKSSHEEYLGEKITGVNGTDINVITDSLQLLVAFENESRLKGRMTSLLRIPETYHYFGFSDTADTITFNFQNGTDLKLNPGTASMTSLYDNLSLPLYLSNTNDYYWLDELEEDSLLYVQYNSAQELAGLSFQAFTDQVTGRIDQNDALKKVAIDLRLNGGGNSAIAQPLINELEELVSAGRLKSSDIYVIIGRRTFSSAILNALELKDAIDPVFIGEPSGGKPNHFGELQHFRLPNSLLRVWYSTKYFNLVPGNDDALEPDVLIELNSDDLINGFDPVMAYIRQA